MLRRLAVVLAFAAAVGLLVSCGGSSHPGVATTTHTATTTGAHASPKTNAHAGAATPLTKTQAIAFAHAVNLTAADVPGLKATSRHEHEHETPVEKRLGRELARCTGDSSTGDSSSSPADLVEEGSKDFKLEHEILHFSVSSEVSVARAPDLAARELGEMRSSHVRGCLSHYLDLLLKYQILKEQTSSAIINPSSISLSISHGTPPAPGATGSFGWRITATVAVHNIKLPFYIDILGFVDGPAEVTLTSTGALRPFPSAAQERLYLLLLKRAEAHRL